MINPDIGIYANNNYIPDIGQFGHQPDIINYPPMQTNAGACNYPGNFTFAVPTSANQLTAGFTQTNLYTNTMTYMNPRQVVPGMGVSWQHTVPNYMPWTDQEYGKVSSSVSFTGKSMVSQSYHMVTSSRPSCSGSLRRNKRHASEDIEECSPENKIFLTEEKMAAKMKNLNISSTNSSSVSPFQLLPDIVLSSNMDTPYCKEAGDLQRLRELEKRLEEDVSESIDREKGGKDKGKPKLRLKINLPDQVAASIFDPEPLLPKRILQDLNKPCMEVVLWKPPLGRPADLRDRKPLSQESPMNNLEEGSTVIAMSDQDSNTLLTSPLTRSYAEDLMDAETMDLE
ncbi:uncharacterized protein LOC125656140 [Ostrea edulis]|uniref:uncharacterized protein LOC125656140 n=1 Tax=Ostrea edulis TaxID=37623 RepID=UPI0020963E12|nr:uncharacterized protein LOC125656140 [Ostrea edulis]XP_048742696.1 uncharacterized protein LOC125656140 [Ostrea edulis]XP_048742704.1 uncharacterized protein LOC125656140 [Ostrea edulis]XP_048742712.1 uncharacterized protein LOC125656140 [Ostrea edulis]